MHVHKLADSRRDFSQSGGTQRKWQPCIISAMHAGACEWRANPRKFPSCARSVSRCNCIKSPAHDRQHSHAAANCRPSLVHLRAKHDHGAANCRPSPVHLSAKRDHTAVNTMKQALRIWVSRGNHTAINYRISPAHSDARRVSRRCG